MATAKIEERPGIILSRVMQKEHDAMVKALGPQGLFSFYARGVYKMGSSTAACTQELALSRLNLTVSSQGALTLKEGKLERLYQPQGGFDGMLAASFCLEVASKLIGEEDGPEAYPTLRCALEGLEMGRSPLGVAFLYLAMTLKAIGYGLEVGHCVSCGSKTDIVAFSPSRGGFLCRECALMEGVSFGEVGELKAFRHAFLCPKEDLLRVDIPTPLARSALAELLRFTEDQVGIRLHSLEAILKY